MCIICTGEIYKQNLDTLQVLNVSDCESLTSEKLQEVLIQCKNLETLYCYNCTSLTSLDLPKGYRGNIDCSKRPWITQNKEFSSNLQRLIKIQKWYRKLLIIKYMKSQEFIVDILSD